MISRSRRTTRISRYRLGLFNQRRRRSAHPDVLAKRQGSISLFHDFQTRCHSYKLWVHSNLAQESFERDQKGGTFT